MVKNKFTRWFSTLKNKRKKHLYIHHVTFAADTDIHKDNDNINKEGDSLPPEVKFELERML